MNNHADATHQDSATPALGRLEQPDTQSEQQLDRLLRLTRQIFQIPVAMLCLTGEQPLRLDSPPSLANANDLLLYAELAASADFLYLPDARQDPRFTDLVSTPGGFQPGLFAGIALRSESGERLGGYCIMAELPRELSSAEQNLFRELADCLASELARGPLETAASQHPQDQESCLHALAATVLDGIIMVTPQGQVRGLNPAAEALFGYSCAELSDQAISQLLAKQPADSEYDYWRHWLADDDKTAFNGLEITGKRKDGSLFPMLLKLGEIAVNGAPLFAVTIRDMSEIKMMELAFKRYEAIIRYSDDAIMSKNLEGIITSWNEGAEKMFGYTAIEVIGRPMLALFPPGKEVEEQNILRKLSQGEKLQHFESVRRRKDGSLIDISVTISPVLDDDGNIIGVSNIARDITEHKRLERMKSEFISTVSHELRTPLTSIRGALDLVLGKSAEQLPDKAYKMLAMAARNSERLTLLINDILDLEKIESGRIEFEFNVMDLVPLARRALEDNEGYAHRHQVELALILGELEQATVYGDEYRLLQVFANLISNAIKFSPPGGRVVITLETKDDSYRITVTDQGPGIPEAFRGRIFQRFAQADSSDTREKGGTGLGLSISKAIVERHDGTIGYVTELGLGTQFYFDLPTTQPMPREHPGLAGTRVLICEDNLDVATILAEMLTQEAVACDIATTAASARALLAKHPYRLLLLDLALPDANGLQLLQELRSDPATRQLPVIVVSGQAMEGRKAFNGSAMTVADWLQKPVDQERLRSSVQHVLQRTEQPHILHVEDNPDVVQIVQTLLDDSSQFSHAASLSEARRLLAKHRYDLVILDLGLADGSGVELLDELKNHCPVVIFSAQTIDRNISELVNAALTKSMTSNEQLLTTIKKLLSQ